MSWTIWHNPRCSKSRQTLALLQSKGVEPTVRRYLDDPPSMAEIEAALTKLAIAPRALMRTKEADYRAQNLGRKDLSPKTLIEAMANTPKLIERPLVIHGDKAVLGRPPENVLDLL